MSQQTIKVSASILGADFGCLKDEIRKCEEAGVDLIHVDVMDGHFVPNITIGPVIIEAIRSLTTLPIEAHLMIEQPQKYIGAFIKAGADILSLQAECFGELKPFCRGDGKFPKEIDALDVAAARGAIRQIKEQNKKVFFVLNPGTPLCLEDILADLDGVLIMSVNPGFAGQKFMPEVLDKVRALKKMWDKDIAIDGGINAKTAVPAVAAGVNILATASYFFGSPDPKGTIKALKAL